MQEQIVSTGIRLLTDEFVRIAKSKNIPLCYNNEYGVNSNIFEWLPGVTVSKNKAPAGSWKKVHTEGTSGETMFKTAVKMSLSQAIVTFTEMLKNGEFDKKQRTRRVIYLTEKTSDGYSIKFICDRFRDGELGLRLSCVFSDEVWRGVDDAWFSC